MIHWIRRKGSWVDAKEAALTTISKIGRNKEPDAIWKIRMLLAEHSPIRLVRFAALMRIPSWVSVHLVRHKIGVEHFVQSQRPDRTGKKRGGPDAEVQHRIELNAQALINISRKRLCRRASAETREAWQELLGDIGSVDQEVLDTCVPECIYRGFCPELETCGFFRTADAMWWRDTYIKRAGYREDRRVGRPCQCSGGSCE